MPLNLLVCNSTGKFRQSCASEIVLGWYIEVRVEFARLHEFSSESCQAWTIASIWIPICFRASVSILGFGWIWNKLQNKMPPVSCKDTYFSNLARQLWHWKFPSRMVQKFAPAIVCVIHLRTTPSIQGTWLLDGVCALLDECQALAVMDW